MWVLLISTFVGCCWYEGMRRPPFFLFTCSSVQPLFESVSSSNTWNLLTSAVVGDGRKTENFYFFIMSYSTYTFYHTRRDILIDKFNFLYTAFYVIERFEKFFLIGILSKE